MRTGRGSTPEIEAERRRKISEAHIGMKHSEESKQKVSQNKKGKPLSDEHKQLLSQIRKGRPKSEEHKRKIAESLKGHDTPEEVRKKLSEKLSGANHPMFGKKVPKDVVMRRAESQRGREFSESHKRNISLSLIGKRSGKNNPMYIGSENKEYCYKFDPNLRERVRAWFNYTCFECGTPQYVLKEQLGVHHVDYNKNACCDGKVVKMIPLCRDCHGKTSAKNWRDHFEKYYSWLLEQYYGGKCYFTKEEYKEIFSQIPYANHTGHQKKSSQKLKKPEIYKYFFFSIQ